MNDTYIMEGGFTPIPLKEWTSVSVFRTFFIERILNLITDQTTIRGNGKKRRKNQKKASNWKDVSEKDIEYILGLIILISINNLPDMKLYWSKDMVIRNTKIVFIGFRYIF